MDPLARFLPPEFAARLPSGAEAWRARVALLLWCLGYPLDMAWSVAMDQSDGTSTMFRTSIARVADDELEELLDATRTSRIDTRHLSFWSVRLGS